MRRIVLAFALGGCMAPEEVLDLDAPEVSEHAWGGYAEEPDEPVIEVAAPEPVPLARARVDAYLGIIEDARGWIDDKTGSGRCTGDFPTLPAVSGDGTVLVLGLGSVAVAESFEASVRLYGIGEGGQLGEHVLLSAGEWKRLSESEEGMEELQRRYCRRLDTTMRELERLRPEPMPVAGAWANATRNKLPADALPWPHVVSNGATRDVDMAVMDIVIARPGSEHTKLKLRPGAPRKCHADEEGEFSKVWSTATVSVFSRGPCGC